MHHSADKHEQALDSERDDSSVASTAHSMIHQGRPVENRPIDLHSIGQFEIAREMESGACGRIFRARKRRRHSTSNEMHIDGDVSNRACVEADEKEDEEEIYALKVIDGECDERLMDVSRQEARILRLLAASPADGEHRHLLCLPTEMWRCSRSNHLHIVFPMRPMDLWQYLTRRNYRALSLPDIGRVMHQTVRAAACLHRQFGIVHNDIKPENVLVEPRTMQCWLTDFGGACELDSVDHDGHIVMTYMYASPERLRRTGDYNELSDSWSLGMLAAELANGKSVVDSLVSERRWSELMRQRQQRAVGRADDEAHRNELLDEPDFVERLAPLARRRRNKQCQGLYAFLFATLALQPDQRLSAAQLLDETRECFQLYTSLAIKNCIE